LREQGEPGACLRSHTSLPKAMRREIGAGRPSTPTVIRRHMGPSIRNSAGKNR
jgi:hypothetical protein